MFAITYTVIPTNSSTVPPSSVGLYTTESCLNSHIYPMLPIYHIFTLNFMIPRLNDEKVVNQSTLNYELTYAIKPLALQPLLSYVGANINIYRNKTAITVEVTNVRQRKWIFLLIEGFYVIHTLINIMDNS